MNNHNVRKMLDNCTSHGWLSLPEAELLIKYVVLTHGPIVEVGSYMGRSAMLFSQLGRVVYCIDPWADGFHDSLTGYEVFTKFLNNVNSIPQGRFIYPVRSRVEDCTLVQSEFVYLDGDHTYQGTRNQIASALCAKPKFIAIHDVNDSGGGLDVKKAALEGLGTWTERVERVAIWTIR